MSDEIAWRVVLAVKPNRFDNLERLTGEMVKSARAELGCLSYQRFATEDRKIVHVYERYSNSGAALEHLKIFTRQFGARYTEMVERTQFTVYGFPSSELRKVLDQFSPQYLHQLGQWEYWA